jgi:hypothetical protein
MTFTNVLCCFATVSCSSILQGTLLPLCHSTQNKPEQQANQHQHQHSLAVQADVTGNGHTSATQDGRQLAADLFESFVGKALLRRFDDSSETVRELATSTFLALLQVWGQPRHCVASPMNEHPALSMKPCKALPTVAPAC